MGAMQEQLALFIVSAFCVAIAFAAPRMVGSLLNGAPLLSAGDALMGAGAGAGAVALTAAATAGLGSVVRAGVAKISSLAPTNAIGAGTANVIGTGGASGLTHGLTSAGPASASAPSASAPMAPAPATAPSAAVAPPMRSGELGIAPPGDGARLGAHSGGAGPTSGSNTSPTGGGTPNSGGSSGGGPASSGTRGGSSSGSGSGIAGTPSAPGPAPIADPVLEQLAASNQLLEVIASAAARPAKPQSFYARRQAEFLNRLRATSGEHAVGSGPSQSHVSAGKH
jgi:hypothetical protein